MADAVDEQVGVVGRQADHRQDLAAARIQRHRGAFQLAERVHHRALQVEVDRQPQVGARRRRHGIQRAHGAPVDVGLQPLVAGLAAQRFVVIALQSGLAGVRVRTAGGTERGLVLLVDAADIADHVREQGAVRVHAAQVRHQLHPGEAPAVDREARRFIVAQAQLHGHRLERPAGRVVAQEARGFLWIHRDHRLQLRQ